MWEPLSSAATWGVQRWNLVDEGLRVGHGQQSVAVLRTAPTFKAPTLEFATHPYTESFSNLQGQGRVRQP
jgi:hypothetical protein